MFSLEKMMKMQYRHSSELVTQPDPFSRGHLQVSELSIVSFCLPRHS